MVTLYRRIVDFYIASNVHVPPMEQYIIAHRFKLYQLAKATCDGLVNGEDFSWLESVEEYTFITCDCKDEEQDMPDHEVNFGDEEDIAVRGATAVDHIDMSQAVMDVITSGCQKCQNGVIQELHNFSKALQWQVKNQKSKVGGVLTVDSHISWLAWNMPSAQDEARLRKHRKSLIMYSVPVHQLHVLSKAKFIS
ncbi:hypothetical protein BDN71DRAFT_1431870 [Pleurotus eryngii]|uniref:Uncharacterized protein n=1 Tax=Pleurotus eryngii TaxID=5323 RepID=A0A9P5ZW42_PLEER|nr:hypothetical protein BDN71DRAFT_1431870 [Pleurotus eryngii]